MSRGVAVALLLMMGLSTETARAEKTDAKAAPPTVEASATPRPARRSIPLMIAGATSLSAGLTMVAVSGIVSAVTPCVTFPGLPSGCDPAFDNTYAAPLLMLGGLVTVISIPLFSIGLERDTGALSAQVPTLTIGAGHATARWDF